MKKTSIHLPRRALAAVLAVLLLAGLVSAPAYASAAADPPAPARARDMEVSGADLPHSGIFDDPRVNQMIDADMETVRTQGWGNLAIPRSLHHLPETLFSRNAREVAQKLLDGGYHAYIVGGSVRDMIMGFPANDFDIVTDAPIAAQERLLDDFTTHTAQTGRLYGFVHFPDETIDVATFQNIFPSYAGAPGIPAFDPEAPFGSNILEDSFQRDLTLNALYYDLETGDILDFHGGLYAIREQVLDTVAEPVLEMAANPVNILRAIRFSARYGFRLSDRLERAAAAHMAEWLAPVTPRNMDVNVEKMYTGGFASACFDALSRYGAAALIYPPVAELLAEEGCLARIRASLEELDRIYAETGSADSALAMAAILWPAVETAVQGGAEQCAQRIQEVLDRQETVYELRFEGRGKVADILRLTCGFLQNPNPTAAEQARLLEKEEHASLALELLRLLAAADARYGEVRAAWTKETASATDFFSDAELNRLIDENYAQVQDAGYAELRIPLSLHGVSDGKISANARAVGQTLVDAGYQAYVTGGAVRDLVLGETVSDFDIATDAPIDAQKELFGESLHLHTVQGVPVELGLVWFEDESIDLAVLQNIPSHFAGAPGFPAFDPTEFTTSSVMYDSFRRDLTINAMYYDLSSGDILDFQGGLRDLRERVLNTVNEPDLQMRNDAPELIRSLRFLSRYDGFSFAPELERAIREHGAEYAALIEPGSAQNQLRRMWDGGYAAACFDTMLDYGIFGCFYPPVKELCKTEAYRTEIRTALAELDRRYASGERVNARQAMAAILLPAVRERGASLAWAEAVARVLDEQAKVYGFWADEREEVAAFLLQAEQTGPGTSDAALLTAYTESGTASRSLSWAREMRLIDDGGDPETTCTRAEAVTYLWLLAGRPDSQAAEGFPEDVAANDSYYGALQWAYRNGIANGAGAGFMPENGCTRAEFATLLYRFAGQPRTEASAGLADVPEGIWYTDAVNWLAEKGLMGVSEAAAFCPDETCTRADALDALYEAVECGGAYLKHYSIFADPRVNRLIDGNYSTVSSEGYAELVVPAKLHHIPEEVFSPNALDAAKKLIAAGYEAYIIGGAVRDLIMHTETNDFDITTNATPEQQEAVLGEMKFHTNQIGLVFGIAVYPDEEIDVAAFQNIPAGYAGLEQIPDFTPGALYGESALQDSFQRDLNFNAIYYDVATGNLLDYHGGLYALREHVIDSMIGDADAWVRANPANIARALRFQARYGFRFSDRLDRVLRENGREYLRMVNAYNVGNHIAQMFFKGYGRRGFEALTEYGLFGDLYPPLAGIWESEEYQSYALSVTAALDRQYEETGEVSPALSMAALLWPAVAGRPEGQSAAEAVKIALDALEQRQILVWMEREEVEALLLAMERDNAGATEAQRTVYAADSYPLFLDPDDYKAPLSREKNRMTPLLFQYVEEQAASQYAVSWTDWLAARNI